jgi:hypothetical protein
MGSYCALWELKAQTWPVRTLYALCTHFVRTLYALYTHFQRHFEKLKVALWDFKVPLLNLKVHFEDRKRFDVI